MPMNDDLARKYKIIDAKAGPAKPVTDVLYRTFTRPITKFLIRTPVTPNQVTFAGVLLGVFGSALFVFPNYWLRVLGAVLLHLRAVSDQVDGIVARVTNQSSRFGGWFDGMLDRLDHTFLFFFISLGEYLIRGDATVWIFGFMAVSGSLLVTMFVPITKMVYPEFQDNVLGRLRKSSIIKNFMYRRTTVFPVLFFFVLINKLYWFLIFAAVYSNLFYVVSFIHFARKFYREERV